jgi:hypothetical protein
MAFSRSSAVSAAQSASSWTQVTDTVHPRGGGWARASVADEDQGQDHMLARVAVEAHVEPLKPCGYGVRPRTRRA